MNFEFDFFPLFLIFAIAWLIPMVMTFMGFSRTPTVILEIIAGILIGPFILDLIPETNYIDFLALTGFIFLMFLGGLEIDVEAIICTLPKKKITLGKFITNPLLSGLIIFLLTLSLAMLSAVALSYIVNESLDYWYFALIMSTSSVGIILPVLKDRGEINLKSGQLVMLAAAIADVLSIILFTFTASFYRNGFDYKMLLIIVLLVAFIIAYYTGRRAVKSKRLQKLMFQLSHAASQIRVRGTLLLILSFVVLSQIVGAEIILGAFLAGIVLSIFLAKQRSSLILKLDGMGYGFLIPVFFVIVGAKLDFSFIKDIENSFITLISLLVFLYFVKISSSLVWVRILGLKKTIASGILLSSRLSLIIAAAEIGKQLEIVSSEMNAVIVVAAIFTCFISPFIYSFMNKKGINLNFKTVIVGGSSVGVLLARRMIMHGLPLLIIENSRGRYKDIMHKGMQVIHKDGTEKKTFQEINLQPNHYVVVTTGSYAKNYEICKMLQSEFNHDKIVTRLTKDQARDFIDTGIIALDQRAIDAAAIENFIIRPTTYHALMESFGNYTVEEMKITKTAISGKQVKDMPFHKDGNLILLKRKDKLLAPHGDTYLKLGDIVSVVGNDIALEDFRQKLS